MKLRALALAAAAFATPAALAQRQLRISPLIETMRETPVFKAPSAKSPVLADATPRTPLLVRAISSKGSWLLVEDEDRNRGWVPTSFTDFSSLGTDPWEMNAPSAPPTKAAPNIFEAPKPVAPPKEERSEEVPQSSRSERVAYSDHQLGLVGSVASNEGAGPGGGLSYAFLPRAGNGQEQYGIWLLGIKRADQWEIPIRFAGRALSDDGRWARGPDVELRYVRRVSRGDWIFGLGYSGSVRLSSRFFAQGRIGLGFNEGVQGELGLQLGWNL